MSILQNYVTLVTARIKRLPSNHSLEHHLWFGVFSRSKEFPRGDYSSHYQVERIVTAKTDHKNVTSVTHFKHLYGKHVNMVYFLNILNFMISFNSRLILESICCIINKKFFPGVYEIFKSCKFICKENKLLSFHIVLSNKIMF